jgi:hypothetical protein
MRPLIVAALLLSLGACGPAVSSACPREVEYSRQQQEAAAMELEAMTPGLIRDTFMPDYGRLRDQARACRGAR